MLEVIFSRPDRPRWMTKESLRNVAPNLRQSVIESWAWRHKLIGIYTTIPLTEIEKFIEG